MSQQVIVVVEDMFFMSKIKATAEHLGINALFVRSAEDACEAATRLRPSLVIVDLHSERCDPFALAVRLKADRSLRGLELLGFFSHVQTALKERAEAAGFDRVLPRSAFTKHLAEILQS